jgi:hypothetical protein
MRLTPLIAILSLIMSLPALAAEGGFTLIAGLDPSSPLAPFLDKAGEDVSRKLGRLAEIEYVPQGGGLLAAARISLSEPDGLTLGFLPLDTILTKDIAKEAPYRADHFLPVLIGFERTHVLVTRQGGPYASLRGLRNWLSDEGVTLVVPGRDPLSTSTVLALDALTSLKIPFSFRKLPIVPRHEEDSAAEEEESLAEEEASLADGEASLADGEASLADEEASAAGTGDSSKNGEDSSQNGDDSANNADDTPKTEEDVAKAEDSAPPADDLAHATNTSDPDSDGAKNGEDGTKAGEDTAENSQTSKTGGDSSKNEGDSAENLGNNSKNGELSAENLEDGIDSGEENGEEIEEEIGEDGEEAFAAHTYGTPMDDATYRDYLEAFNEAQYGELLAVPFEALERFSREHLPFVVVLTLADSPPESPLIPGATTLVANGLKLGVHDYLGFFYAADTSPALMEGIPRVLAGEAALAASPGKGPVFQGDQASDIFAQEAANRDSLVKAALEGTATR